MSSKHFQPNVWEFYFTIRIIGGSLVIAGWSLYNIPLLLGFKFELIPFEEIVKILILGTVLVGMSFWLERDQRRLEI